MTEGNGAGRIYWVGGSKGGVGKSMMTVAMLDRLLEQKSKVVLVECDTSNPDVWKAYREQVETELINLDEADGWIHLVNTCDRRREAVVVINTAARNNLAVKQYGRTLDSSLEELGTELVALWVINRQRDSLELLREFIDAVPKAVVHVVRNGYFVDEKKFELYNGSKIREEVEGRGGKSITLSILPTESPTTSTAGASRWVWRRRSFLSATERSSGGGAGRSARSSPEFCRERRGDVREGCRSTRLRRRASAPLPPARRARPARERRILEHRDGARVLRLVLPEIPGRARGAHGTLHRGRTRGIRGSSGARGRARACSRRCRGRSWRRTSPSPARLAERPFAASTGDDALGRGGAVRRAVRDRRATAWRGP